ncbi:metallopeptidase, partial [Trypanosoma theileri]
ATVNEPRRENWFEVMGLLLGHFREGEMTVTGAFGLPVDASEVECSMNDASQLYMLDFLQYYQRGGIHREYEYQQEEQEGKEGKEEEEEEEEVEGCIGWYHSHPGYTCFLSGTDVDTQQLSQSAQDPWLAIVVDPVRTIATGRLDMKAFRTFPEAYAEKLRGKQQQQEEEQEKQKQARHTNTSTTNNNSNNNNSMNTTGGGEWRRNMTSTTSAPIGGSNSHHHMNMNMNINNNSISISGSVPSERIREYGVHAHRYYELPITLVRSKNDEALLDRLWCRYWALTFMTNPLISNRYLMTQQIHQLATVLENNTAAGKGFVRSGKQQQHQQRQKYQINTLGGGGAIMDVDSDNNNDEDDDNNNDAFEQSCVQVRYLASSLASEVTLGGTLISVKNAAFSV